jgi:hypothetical protein
VANAIPPVLIELQLETAKIAAQMQQLTGDFANFGKTVEKQGGFLEKFKATAAGVFTGNLMTQGLMAIQGAIGGAIKDAQEYEVLLNKTAAVIKSTGNAAGISAEGLRQHASALEKISAVDENMILNGENVIATFTNIRNVAGEGNDIFNQTTTAALDLSVALGQDMQSSAIQLGKALNDPIKGVTALQRVGVTFDAQQKESIKTMVEAGNVMGAQKIILAEMSKEFGGAAAAAGDTFAGAVSRAKDKAQDFGRDLVTNLQPILLSIGKTIGDLYTKYLAPLFSWLGKNKEAVATFVAIIGTAVLAFKIYKGILIATAAAQELYVVALALMKGAKLADVVATEAQTGAMVLLNAVMNANPIALVVAAVALLAAGFVYLWNKSDGFRAAMIKVFQVLVNGAGYIVGAIGKLLELASKIPGIGGKFKNISTAVNDAANDVRKFSDNLDKLQNAKISIPGFGGKKEDKNDEGGATAPGGGKTAEQIKAEKAAAKQRVKDIEAANKDVEKIYGKMHDAIDAGNKKMAEAAVKRDKAIIDAKQKYADLETKITQKKNDELKKNEDEWNKAYAKARDEARRRDAEIEAAYTKKKAAIEEDYLAKKVDLNAAAEDKITNAKASAAEKQASIVQKSIDRLTKAFASGTAANIADIFKEGAKTADNVIASLKSKLAATKELQKNAALLQAAGYSQVFIEEIVKAGPEAGNEMATALLNASGDTQKELQSLYGEVNNISETGLNSLAKTMSVGSKLATQELIDEYNAIPKELAVFIAQTNNDLQKSLAKANEDYLIKLAEAAANRDEALAESKARLDEALAAADAALAEANAATMKEFNEALKENAANLADALAEIMSNYDDTIAEIAANMKQKLAELQDDLLKTIEALKALGAAQAATAAAAKSPATLYSPVLPGKTVIPSTGGGVTDSQNAAKYTNYFNTSVTGVNMSDPNAAAKAVDNTLRFGAPQSLGSVYAAGIYAGTVVGR